MRGQEPIAVRPVVALVGAEYEENLSLRYLAAAIEAHGFRAEIVAFDEPDAGQDVADAVFALGAIVVGISVPFQHRAGELLGIATRLRERGYRGHICAGGHFATFEFVPILRDVPAVDSIVRHEGEEAFVEVCMLVRDGAPVPALPGLVVRTRRRRLPLAGAAAESDLAVGPKRPLPPLDSLPMPDRRGEPQDVLGVRSAPLVGSRGCYADCTFCCIYAYADNAAGPRYRMRSVESIAAEMRQEYERRGVRLFIFHDDNFFVPHVGKNLARYRRLAALLREAGMVDIGLVIKCRPNDVDPELFALLKEMGMIRAYVGIETNSEEGVISLRRGITPDDNQRALAILRELDIYHSFNMLIFDPEATLAGLARNLDFMEEHADVPWNFCRAEVYAGTPLKATLAAEGRLVGNYMAWSYEMRDPRVEVLFRICMTVFHGRNFKVDGLATLNMGLRLDGEVVRRFYPGGWDRDYHRRLVALSRAIGEDTIRHVREALAFVQEVDVGDRARVHAFTLALARGVARSDLALLAECKALRRETEARSQTAGAARMREFGHGMPVWAAETQRLGSSTGRELSTESLPRPAIMQSGAK